MLTYPLSRFLRIFTWICFLFGAVLLANSFFGFEKTIFSDGFQGYILGTFFFIIACASFLINYFRYKFTRRGLQLLDARWQLHWLLISTYRYEDDPTFLSVKEARHALSKWDCYNPQDVLNLIVSYQKGEINDAFDATRILWLSELACTAGWMGKEELFRFSQESCARIVQKYSRWHLFADDLIVGRNLWYGKDGMPYNEKQRSILARQYAEALSKKIQWKLF